VAVARRYGARETSSRRNLVLAHSMGCSLALRLAAEWGTNGVSVAALALLGATDVVPAVAASPIFRLPLCLLDRLQPLLSAGFEARALHEVTRAGKTADHRGLLELCKACNGANPMFMCKAYYRQLEVPTAHQLALVRAPALLLCGEQDLLVPVESSTRLQALLPSAELQRIPQTAHQMMQEQPAAVHAVGRRSMCYRLRCSLGGALLALGRALRTVQRRARCGGAGRRGGEGRGGRFRGPTCLAPGCAESAPLPPRQVNAALDAFFSSCGHSNGSSNSVLRPPAPY
jgi:surfactin synthase thioesterase subunit